MIQRNEMHLKYLSMGYLIFAFIIIIIMWYGGFMQQCRKKSRTKMKWYEFFNLMTDNC